MEINRLSAVDTVAAGDLLPIFSQTNGDTRKCALSVLAAYIQTLITSTDDKLTQYAAPSATGFTVQINDDALSVWLILTPVAGYAAGTIKMPLLANCTDKQEVMINTTQAVTTLAMNANGATITGAPTTLAANAFFKLRFDAVFNSWYRVA